MIPTITIACDRQHGKTRTALDLALLHVITGRRVLFVSHRIPESTEAFRQMRDSMGTLPCTLPCRVISTSGRQRIELDDGGRVYFLSVMQTGARGLAVDTVVIDDVEDADGTLVELVPCLNASTDPRIIIVRQSL